MAAKVPITSTDQVTNDTFDGFGPIGGVILPSFNGAAADPAPVEFTPPKMATTLAIIINVSVISGAGATITINLEGFDKASQSWVILNQSVGLVATGNTINKVGIAIAGAANVAFNGPLFETMRVRPVKSGTTTTLVYSVGAQFN